MQLLPNREDARQIARGLLMGGADIIPGVSGGTVALVLGIYERLVTAISHVDARFVSLLRARDWSAAARHIDLRFLITLALGIGLGIVSLASLMHHLLTHHRSYTLAGFFGLILASSLLVGRMAGGGGRRERLLMLGLGLAGAVVALWLVSQQAIISRPGLGYTFACGMVAICAMILPGISGAYILLLLGKYIEITGIIKKLPRLEVTFDELTTLAVFAVGCAIGLIVFSKFLRWLLERWHGPTMATLCGFMLGSLYRIWPFQADTTPEVAELSHKIYKPIWPRGFDREVVACLIIAVVAVAGVLLLDHFARRDQSIKPFEKRDQ